MKISIVVPIYNVEKFLNKCILSIINQTYKNLQIILVNDGSTDSSGNICDFYKTVDNRIQVIHKENGGLSSARNAGFKAVTGDYVIFVDSDDYLELNALEKMLNECVEKKLDILNCRAKIELENGDLISDYKNNIHIQLNKVYSGKQIIKISKYQNILPMIWLNMYKVSFLKNNNLVFKNGIYHEDSEFTPRAIYFAEKIEFSDFVHYHQVLSSNSIIRSKNVKKCFDLITVSDSLKYFLKNDIKENDIKDYINDYSDYLLKASVDSALNQDIKNTEFLYKKEINKHLIDKLSKSKRYKIIAILLKFHLVFILKLINRTRDKMLA